MNIRFAEICFQVLWKAEPYKKGFTTIFVGKNFFAD